MYNRLCSIAAQNAHPSRFGWAFWLCMKKEIEDFLECKKDFLDPKSVQTYRRNLEILWENVRKPIEEVGPLDLSKMVCRLSERYASKTVQNVMNTVHCFFKFWGPEKECLSHERICVPRAQAEPRYVTTDDDFEALLRRVDQHTPVGLQKALILHLLWFTGMRVGEIVKMRIDQVSLEGMSAVVKTEKTMKHREVFWEESTQELMRRYLALRVELRDGPFLFIGLNRFGIQAPHMNQRTVERWMKDLVREAGLDSKLVPHSFRHSRIQRWFAAGLNAYEVIALTGHSSITSLQAYMRMGHPLIKANARRTMTMPYGAKKVV